MLTIYALLRNKPCFLRYTNNNEIAAGVIPEIRDALPIVSGRVSVSFATTSFDKPEICEKSKSKGINVFSWRFFFSISSS